MKRYAKILGVCLFFVFFLLLSMDGYKGESSFLGRREKPLPAPSAQGKEETKTISGEASWYGPGFHGKETASGETFNQNKMTAASPTLPLGSDVEISNPKTGKKVEVEITDRGPYAESRKIDVSKGAAKELGIISKGVAKVKIKVKKSGTGKRKKKGQTRNHKKTEEKKP